MGLSLTLHREASLSTKSTGVGIITLKVRRDAVRSGVQELLFVARGQAAQHLTFQCPASSEL